VEYEKWMWQAKLFEGEQRCDADFTNVPFQVSTINFGEHDKFQASWCGCSLAIEQKDIFW